MINLLPWKLLNRGAPVNKPGADWFNAVTEVLTTAQIEWTDDPDPSIVRPNTNGQNWRIRIPRATAGSSLEKELWDLYEVTDTTAKVRGSTYAAWITGAKRTITAGTAGYTPDAEITFSGAKYIYLKMEIDITSPSSWVLSCTFEVADSIPDGDETAPKFTYYKPLWYIAWSNGAIDRANCIRLPDAQHTQGSLGIEQVTVVTDIQYDTSTKQLQKKTRKVWVLPVEAASSWTMITGGQAEECST